MNKLIEIKDLTKTYNQAHEQIIVLENLFLNASKGEFISIVGPSGSGKSTLLNIIGLLDDIYSGSVLFAGSDISGMRESEKAAFRLSNIGFVFQFDSLLPEFTVLENIEMPALLNRKPSPKHSRDLLKRFGLEKLADKYPVEISGGEKQRAAILRAMRNSPRIIIADEPTGNLDRHNAGVVLDDLKNINSAGTTVVMVTHNEESAKKYSDSVYMMENAALKPLP